MNNTCFVIMPVGTQTFGGITITEEQLREKYDFIIKNAILKANPNLEVIRSDDEFNPGSISNDILTKLMHSQFVIADITYPNPNVFYELGIRHAIKTGTILIREKTDFNIPFDISHLRCIEYTQDISGMSKLSEQLVRYFDFYQKNPNKPDNQFLELCHFTDFVPSVYEKQSPSQEEAMITLITAIMRNPALIEVLYNQSLSKEEQQKVFLKELGKNPEAAKEIIKSLQSLGPDSF